MLRKHRIERVLTPGQYRFWDPLGRKRLRSMDVTRLEQDGRDVDTLIATLVPQLEQRYSRSIERSAKPGLARLLKDRSAEIREWLNAGPATKPES